MKKFLIVSLLALAVSGQAQTESTTVEVPMATGANEVAKVSLAPPAFTQIGFVYVVGGRITVTNPVTSPVPVYLTSTPDSAESASTTFWQGVGVGFAWGGIAWIFRLVRQTAKQNPEI